MKKLMAHHIQICNHFTSAEHPITDITYRLCHWAGRKTPGSELTTIGALFDWFGHIYDAEQYSHCEGTALPNAGKVQALKPVLEYIEQNYMEEITLDVLAKQAHISIPYFSRIFRTMTHRTPIEYLTYFRIDRACYYLATTDLPVTEVAYKCGFHDCSYFARTFKKEKGITPKQYQKQCH